MILVTNLKDSGKGSLRAACEASGPRMVVIQVSGTIRLRSAIEIRNPYITIAGQRAPAGGLCLRDHTLVIATHDVVVRYLRSRLGDESEAQDDCITFATGAANSIIDHCSATWSVDECLSLTGKVSHVTVQWCLIGESLKHSLHKKGDHGFGSLARANGPVSLHHNLWLHNDARNPRLGDDYGRPPEPFFDVRNNVIYDFGGTCTGLTQGKFAANYVANYIKPGPSSRASTPITVGDPSNLRFFIRGNLVHGNRELSEDNTRFFNRTEHQGTTLVRIVDKPFAAPRVLCFPAEEAYERVLNVVGASLPKRDAVDARLVEHVRSGTGVLLDSQKSIGGWPELGTGTVPPDRDGDGMPDDWEREHGQLADNASDASADPDGDGYTNLEEYLNGTDPRAFIDYRDPANNRSSL